MGTSKRHRHKVTSFNLQMTSTSSPSKEVPEHSVFPETLPMEKGTFPGLTQEKKKTNEKALIFYCSLTLGLSREERKVGILGRFSLNSTFKILI